jgi:hypothetical protein
MQTDERESNCEVIDLFNQNLDSTYGNISPKVKTSRKTINSFSFRLISLKENNKLKHFNRAIMENSPN